MRVGAGGADRGRHRRQQDRARERRAAALEYAHCKAAAGGSQRERDAAYHNGAAWPWLLGAYVDAQIRTYPQRPEDAQKALEGLIRAERPGALLSVPELFDPATGAPGGCPLQAWSVGEALRAGVLLERMRSRARPSHMAMAKNERME